MTQAIPYGNKTTWEIHPQALALYQARKALHINSSPIKTNAPTLDHKPYVAGWVKAMANGTLNGRPFSPVTLSDYRWYIERFLMQHPVVTLEALKTALADSEPHQFAKRDHLFKAVVCFAKHLIAHEVLSDEFLTKVKPYKLKRVGLPQRHSLEEGQLDQLLAVCQTVEETALVWLLAGSGIRASECCAVQVDHLDLEAGTVLVAKGKGGLPRRLGLPAKVCQALRAYIEAVQPTHWLFVDKKGQQMKRTGLFQRLERLGKVAGFKVSPHALRRAFVTINANKGRPLVILQRSCGHSRIQTTMGYVCTTEQQVIEAMQGWD